MEEARLVACEVFCKKDGENLVRCMEQAITDCKNGKNAGLVVMSPEFVEDVLIRRFTNLMNKLEEQEKKIEELEERIAIMTEGSGTGETVEENAADPFDFPCTDPAGGV